MAKRTPEYVKIRRGVKIVASYGPIKLAVDRVSQERALVFDTPAGGFPVAIDLDDYLQLGIAIIRDAATTHDFSEAEERPAPEIERVDPLQGDRRPPEPIDELEMRSSMDDEIEREMSAESISDSVRTEMVGPEID